MEIYDLIIIGAGPAGYLGAERAGSAGLKTLLIEKNKIGGVCLNEGCIPSKTLLYSAKLFDGAAHGEKYGISVENIKLDQKAVISRKDKVVKKMVAGVNASLRASNITVIAAEAHIEQKKSDGYIVSAGDEKYTGKRLLIASGSSPVTPPIPGLKEGLGNGFVLTNKEILELETIPDNLVVIGAGIIGLEMASYYNSAGSSVTMIEMLDHIAGQTDAEISEILRRNYEKKGIVFNLDSKVISIGSGNVTYEQNGQTFSLDTDKVLLSIGRRPVVKGLGLENIGVEIINGAVVTDLHCKTNIPDVYAAGDVNGKSMLAHTAYREAEVAVNNMLGKKDTVRYDTIPGVIYTNPEVAGIGETEASAKEKGLSYETVRMSMMYSGRYAAENEGGNGICKLLIDKGTRKLLGVHMIGNPVSEIIFGAGIMMETEMRVEDMKELVFPHPTVSEIIREGIFDIK